MMDGAGPRTEMLAGRFERRRGADATALFVRPPAPAALPARETTGRRGNVVPFLRLEGARRSPDIAVDAQARPAPMPARRFDRGPLLSWLLASLALHAGAFLVLARYAPPLASVGVQSISVEIVLGTDADAGNADRPTKSDAAIDSAASKGDETAEPDPQPDEAKAPAHEAEPRQQPAAPEPEHAEAAPTITEPDAPTEVAPATQDSPPPPVRDAEPATTTPEPPAETAPSEVERPNPVREAAKPKRPPAEPVKTSKPAKPHPETRHRQQKEKDADVSHPSRTSSASVASSGIGRGRSDAETNYRGIVAAQLARNKFFPPDARRKGERGNAVISFNIDVDGRVTSVSLVRSTGIASLDHEAQAMVRRASPFPPPPAHRAMRFTVPVSFDLR